MYKTNKPVETVKSWFEDAKRGRVHINMWYDPFNKAFHKLAKKSLVHDHFTGLWEYQNGLYEVYAGSGDCEELMRYVGPIK